MSKKRGLMEEVAEFLFPSDSEQIGLKAWLIGKSVPCFLCKRELDVRFSKKNRPYLTCNKCQVQTFVRGREGFHRLVALVKRQEE
jgi:hypothetical protein